MRYVLIVAYDGLAYCGWQTQSHHSTIAGVLTRAFNTAFCCQVHLLGASRTDAQVHALGQVVLATTPLELDPETVKLAWNARLGYDIHIRKLSIAPDTFNPRAHVVQKTYFYHFFLEKPLPGWARYGMWCRNQIDHGQLNACLQLFVGTHDFRSFCTGYEQKSTVRTVDSIEYTYLRRYRVYRITVKGRSFLRYMIRRMVGAAFDVARQSGVGLDDIARALRIPDPQQRLTTAQPHGLVLRKIDYAHVPDDVA